MKISKLKKTKGGYEIILQNEKDVIELSKLFFKFSGSKTIEEYQKYLRGNDRIGYYEQIPLHIKPGDITYKTFIKYIKDNKIDSSN